MTPIENILDIFYSLIYDVDFGRMSSNIYEPLCINYIKLASTKFKECKKDLNIVKTDDGTFIKDKLTDEECSILAYGATYYYIEPKLKHSEILKNRVNTKDANSLSNANLIRAMYELQTLTKKEFLAMRRSYQYQDFKGWD